MGYNSSTYSLRHQGSDINTEETAEKNITKNSIFPMQAIPQVEGLAITALRGYWPLLQSCGDCFLFISVIFFHVLFAVKSILWMVHSVHLNTFSGSLTLLGPVAVPFLARAQRV